MEGLDFQRIHVDQVRFTQIAVGSFHCMALSTDKKVMFNAYLND